tara:strand:+ start:92 stop:787 length:696 start_codon:yes stop_codon:yes gene_type:complete
VWARRPNYVLGNLFKRYLGRNVSKKDKQEMIYTEWRRLNMSSHDRIRLKYGFSFIKGNRAPYFSITCDIAEPRNRYNSGEKRVQVPPPKEMDERDWPTAVVRIVGGGVVSKEDIKIFPDLAPLLKWHCVYDNGEPMHYLPNAKFWFEKYLGVFKLFKHSEPEGRKEGEPEPLEAFKSTIVFGALSDDDKRLETLKDSQWTEIESWLKKRLPKLRKAMKDTMDQFGVPYLSE